MGNANKAVNYYKLLNKIVGRRFLVVDNFFAIAEFIQVQFGINTDVTLYDVPEEDRIPGEDNRIDFAFGVDISGSIWYLNTNNPLRIYITEVSID